jgi:hypothetical protein
MSRRRPDEPGERPGELCRRSPADGYRPLSDAGTGTAFEGANLTDGSGILEG